MLPDGSPHSVPIWAGREGDRIAILTSPRSRKARNDGAHSRPGRGDGRRGSGLGHRPAPSRRARHRPCTRG
ncbi:pyridoxamine 5'-phosphate oxidase family protein [Dactylosporangium sp. CA-139114]|uniref:pyridoxamine 5'-phosphate oxidase family protein n=1 Tax=Dactylosporangium sp. CA-139114 TaxID=3239931 RepID=UPI003D965ADB